MELGHLRGVGKVMLKKLNDNNIFSTTELIYHFPKNYIVYEPNEQMAYSGNNVFLTGIVDSRVQMFKFRGKTYAFSFYLKCETIRIKVSLFTTLYAGILVKSKNKIGIYGKYSKKGSYFSCKKIFLDDFNFKIENEYKLKDLADSSYQRIVDNYFAAKEYFKDSLPEEIINKYKLLDLNTYLYKSHFPQTKNDIVEVLRRRKYEEFFWFSIQFDYIRNKRFKDNKKKRLIDFSLIDDIKNKLPYELSIDQNKALDDIVSDLKKDYTMNRIIQGDVGCGKTIIAIIISLLFSKANMQIAIMAPTEILAYQHYESFKKLLMPYGVKVDCLVSSLKQKDKNEIYTRLIEGRLNVLIGTHALIYDKVKFLKLGLVIIDEQHRFGVEQRLKLINKYNNVDSLFLSATPIPRTLGLTMFSDLDISSIKTMPKGRLDIITKIVSADKTEALMKSIKNHLNMGEQAYVVCPLIEDNEDFDYMDLNSCYDLFKEYFDEKDIAIIHGKMKSDLKDLTINKFKNGGTKILISTTVIEVGINIPNATMMIIMDPERFGLATLHQLRGRVGRGDKQSYCMLVTKDLENSRLKAMEEYSDGFNISEIDFKLRGPGDFLGEDQSGFNSLEYVSLENDINILRCAKEDSRLYFSKFINKEYTNKEFAEKIRNIKVEIDKIN
ncbi:MAG: ATP-dependent DNA helicase RecG [Acholeplasmatales bacterium]|nr:ATP-dependent DNA helicase RecG [Acholeplasmatales bacterium]